MHTLQQIVMPNLRFGAAEAMYVRQWSVHTRCDLADGIIHFQPGGIVTFDTYFNAFNIDVWKTHSGIDQLSLTLSGTGRFALRWGLRQTGCAQRWLDEQTIRLQPGEPLIVTLTAWPELTTGLLYFRLQALDAGELIAAAFQTTQPPRQDIRLGLVITHYNRQQWVIPAIQRIQQQLLAPGPDRLPMELIVVDNSRNLTDPGYAGVTLLPNRNLGGSGGFARGLLYLRDSPLNYTHCLFMDDDASCEIESIRRTFMLLSYTPNPAMAVAGSLLRQAEPYRLYEKGACFDGICQPLKGGLNMLQSRALLQAEEQDCQPDYGGWWFFAFRIDAVRHFPFPFFVRGDDILFSLMNRFDILTLNGIACWGEDFGVKSGPLPIYLDVRNHILQMLTVVPASRLRLVQVIATFFAAAALSYRYATASAVIRAVEDSRLGPAFWVNNLDMTAIRQSLAAASREEAMQPVDRSKLDPDPPPAGLYEPWPRTLFRFITLNGFLLPGFLLRNECIYQPKDFRGILRHLFRYRTVLYEDPATHTGFVASYDRQRFFAGSWRFAKALAGLLRQYPKVKQEAEQAIRELATETFWRQVYDLPADGASAAGKPLQGEASPR